MKINRWAMLSLAMAAAGAIACGGGGSSDRGSDSGDSGAGGRSTSAAPDDVSPAASKTKGAEGGSAPDSSGTPQADFRGTSGSDQVRCGAIDSELAVRPYRGQIVWTATALDRTTQSSWPLQGNVLNDVSFSPATGVLPDGQSAIVHISGSVSGLSEFAVVVSAPNHSGRGWVTIVFHCV
jgi:hypothetical protein